MLGGELPLSEEISPIQNAPSLQPERSVGRSRLRGRSAKPQAAGFAVGLPNALFTSVRYAVTHYTTDGVMRWLLIGYMFLFIDRPFEVWPWLGDLHVERIYMLFTLAVWAVYPNKRWLPNVQHAAYAAFALAVALCWIASPWAEQGQNVVEDWFKIVV